MAIIVRIDRKDFKVLSEEIYLCPFREDKAEFDYIVIKLKKILDEIKSL